MSDIGSIAIPSKVDPIRLTSLLQEAGWRTVGGRQGSYARFAPPGTNESITRSSSLIIPLDSSAPDYMDVMRSALLQLSKDRDLWTRSIYPRLSVESVDEFRFRKESEAPTGLIPWRDGQSLIESARRALIAGAKSFMGPGRHFVNRHGTFASRYLDQVLMGQTAPGSYIVTAYAPPNAAVAIRGSADASRPTSETGAAQVRAVNEAVVRAIEATVEAVEHYKSIGSLAGFEDGVARGVSYEMTNALLGVASDSSEADITIEWDPGDAPPSHAESRFIFHPSDVEPLSRAAVRLAEDDSSEFVSIRGRVHLLAKKEAGSPGVFGIDSLQPEGPKKVRVRLADEEDYHEAIKAHEGDLAVQVAGRLEKEGNLSWLYDATVIRVLGHIDQYIIKRSKRGVIPGQIDLFGGEE